MSVMTSPSLQVGTNFQSMRTLQPNTCLSLPARLRFSWRGLLVEQGGHASLAPGLPGSKGTRLLLLLPIRCRPGFAHMRVLNVGVAAASAGVIS